MKRIPFIVIAILLVCGVALGATPGYRQDPGTGDVLGQGKYQSDPHKIFRMVRYVPVTYSGAATVAKDRAVIRRSPNPVTAKMLLFIVKTQISSLVFIVLNFWVHVGGSKYMITIRTCLTWLSLLR